MKVIQHNYNWIMASFFAVDNRIEFGLQFHFDKSSGYIEILNYHLVYSNNSFIKICLSICSYLITSYIYAIHWLSESFLFIFIIIIIIIKAITGQRKYLNPNRCNCKPLHQSLFYFSRSRPSTDHYDHSPPLPSILILLHDCFASKTKGKKNKSK